MQSQTHTVTAHDGEQLLVREYAPNPPDDARRTWLIVHGVGEHGGRYAHVAEELVARGWKVIAFDLRGHGHSTGSRAHVRQFDDYLKDVADVATAHQIDWASTALFGHSFGGLLAVRAVQAGHVQPAAVALSAPMLRVKLRIPPWKLALGHLVWRLIPEARFRTNIDAKNLTRDPQFLEKRRADPLIQRHVTAGWFFRTEAARQAAWDDAAGWTTPVVIAQGTDDATTDPTGPGDWLAQVAASSKQLLLFPDHVHELLNEADWQETLRQVCEVLETYVPIRKV